MYYIENQTRATNGKLKLSLSLFDKTVRTERGAVASWLVRSSPDQAIRVRALAGYIVLCG